MKNAKHFWRLLGCFLIPAIFFAFGGSTLRAQGTYKKITSTDELTEGEYLIVCETKNETCAEYGSKGYTNLAVSITAEKITINASDAAQVFELNSSGTSWTIKEKGTSNYVYVSAKNALGTQTSTADWTISFDKDGNADIAGTFSNDTYHIKRNSTQAQASPFRAYTSGQDDVQLYKKQESCGKVTNVQENVEATKVILTWAEPATAPANGYKVTITAGSTEVVKDAAVAAGTTTYTKDGLDASTEYTYSIVSACSETAFSDAVTGTFSTPAADAKTLNVAMSGDVEGESYTTAQPIVFTFTTSDNFTLGNEGKISYTIMSDDDGSYENSGIITASPLSLNNIPVGKYMAEFELVDMTEASLTPKVTVEKNFTVKLPTVAAPEFSLAEQTEAFTEAQTITLSTTTNGATIHYAINNAEFADYTTPIVLDETGTFTIEAFATKTGMDTSAKISKTYKLKLPISGIVVFEKTFTQKDDLDEGWESSSIYTEDGCIRLGKGGEAGWIQLPEQHLLNKFTLLLIAKQYNKDALSLSVTVNGKNAKTTESLTDEYEEYVVPFTFTGDETIFAELKIEGTSTGNARFYLQTVKIYQATETPEECHMVEGLDDDNRFEGTTATITWQTATPAPKVGYAIEVRTDDEANTLIKKDTVKELKEEYSYKVEDLTPGTDYVFTITTLCTADRASESADLHFHMPAADMPTLNIDKPTGGVIRRANVSFEYKITNFKLGTDEESDGQVKYTIRGTNLAEPITGFCTDTVFGKQFTRSGKDTVWLELVDKNGEPLDTRVTARRAFTIDLPNVARPRFTPTATSHKAPIDVAILCDTVGATIFYSLNDAPYQEYTETIKLTEEGTYTFTTFAVKPLMDTSAVYTKTYTLKFPAQLEPGVMFYEPFDGLEGAGGDISSHLDDYTDLPGWTGEVVYMQVAGIAKMGTGKLNGYLQTPAIENLTEGAKYLLTFDAQAWNNDSDKLTVTIDGTEYEMSGMVNNENVGNNGTPTQMKTFEKEFTATASTTIRIASNGDVGKSRFFLDNVKVQVASDDPVFNVSPATLTMGTVQGTPVSKKVTVTGRNLTEDITVSCPEGNFSVTPATLAKEAVMGENGAELTVTFNGSVAADTETITLTCGELTKTIAVSATAETAQEVENLAALREEDADESTVYKVTGQVVVTAVDGISVWAQDASAAILIYGATGQQYKAGDGITGIYGTLKNYNDLLELIPAGNQPEATSHDNTVEPQLVTIEELDANAAEYSSRLIRINGLTLGDAEGTWTASTNYTAADEDGNELTIRTTITKGSYIGEELPEGKFDLVAVAGIFKGAAQVSPRVSGDIMPVGRGGDECEAPTNLKAVVADKSATLTWNGAAEQYRVVVMLGEEEVCNELVSEKTYTLSNLEVGTYAWKVASVCEEGEQWANGEAFEVKPVANDNTEELVCRLYPNPTDGVFYLEMTENARMEIFTLGGTVIRNEELVAGRNEIRLYQSGIYFIRLSNANAVTVKRVVVR